MKPSRQSRTTRDRKSHLSADAERLVTAALGMANSGSRVEDRFWDAQLSLHLDTLLNNSHVQPVYDALERLHQTDIEAYGALVEAVEENAESLVIEHEGQAWQVLLVSAPLIAWTRFQINSGPISASATKAIAALWRADVLASDVNLHLMPAFCSVDQLPRDYGELRKLAHVLGRQAVTGKPSPDDERPLPDSAEMLADARFIVGALAAPVGHPVFRWQSPQAREQQTRIQSLENWVEHFRPLAEQLLPGCGFESLLPDAYHINMRESDRRVRPYGIRAAVHYMTHALNIAADQITATIGGFGYERCDEYRIGLSVDQDGEEIAHGIVWPLLGPESEQDEPSPLARITELLGQAGVTQVRHWAQVVEPEYCEDCGAPLYPNEKADVVHAEMPADIAPESTHFH